MSNENQPATVPDSAASQASKTSNTPSGAVDIYKMPAKKMFSPKQLFGFGPDKEILPGYAEQPAVTRGYKSNPNYIFTKEQIRMLMACYVGKIPLYIAGLEGCGKTSGLIEFLLRLNQPFRVFPGSPEIDRYGLFGTKEFVRGETKYTKSAVTECYQHGWTVIIDELGKCNADASVSLNAVRDRQPLYLEENGGEVVPMAEGFWLAATSNGNGSGKNGFVTEKKQDRSLMSGFALLKATYLPMDEEVKVLLAHNPNLPQPVAELLVTYANDTRAAAEMADPDKQIEVPLSTRGLKMAADICVMTISKENPGALKDALDVCYLNKLTAQDRTAAETLWSSFKSSP